MKAFLTQKMRDPDENFFNEINTQNFEYFYLFPNEIESFLSEKENYETNSSNLHLPNFNIISQERKTNKCGGGVLTYIHKSLKCNLRNDLRVSDKDKEILTIEISRENYKNILLSCCYRPPNGDSENLSTF